MVLLRRLRKESDLAGGAQIAMPITGRDRKRAGGQSDFSGGSFAVSPGLEQGCANSR